MFFFAGLNFLYFFKFLHLSNFPTTLALSFNSLFRRPGEYIVVGTAPIGAKMLRDFVVSTVHWDYFRQIYIIKFVPVQAQKTLTKKSR